MEVSETWVLEVDGYQFLYLSSEQWIWTYSVQILCTDGVCLDEPFFTEETKNLFYIWALGPVLFIGLFCREKLSEHNKITK